MDMRKHANRTAAWWLIGGAISLAGLSGCNIVAPAYYLIHGPEKAPKVYALDKTKTTVIFIDDRANKIPRRALRISVGDEAEKTLLKQKTVKDMVSSQSALAAAGNDHSDKPLSVTEIGEAVKAQVVIYATVDAFSLSGDGTTFAPFMKMRVRVVDVASDTRLFPPDDPKGYQLTSKMPASAHDIPTGTSARYQAEDELAKYAGVELAQLFFDHEPSHNTKVPE
jgi:hypothetical protein